MSNSVVDVLTLVESYKLTNDQILLVALRLASLELAIELSKRIGKSVNDISVDDVIKDYVDFDTKSTIEPAELF